MAPLISVHELGIRFGDRFLFKKLTLSVEPGERIAVLGANGSGKSTLFRIIAGEVDPDEGTVALRKGLTVDYVKQSEDFCNVSIYEALQRRGVSDLAIKQNASRFDLPELSTNVDTLSGGMRKRIAIVRSIVLAPEFVLYDEPTNHLDVDSILWLEEVLKKNRNGCMFISHDRAFIDRVATRVVEINNGFPDGFFSVEGNYEKYLVARDGFVAELESRRSSLANKVRRETEWLNRNPSAQRCRAKARVKGVEQLQSELSSMGRDRGVVGIEIRESERKTNQLVRAEQLGLTLDRSLFTDLDFILSPGTKLGVIGVNGCGKSSFINVISGAIRPTSGKINFAPELKIVKFSQNREFKNLNLPLRQALCPEGDQVVFNGKVVHVAAWAARFLFRTDQLGTAIGSLSGGERARVLLAQIMCEPADILILDEPTNDLDIPTLEALENTLLEYQGALVVVSHDRYFIDSVSTRILGFGEGGAQFYASWEQWQSRGRAAVSREDLRAGPSSSRSPTAKRKPLTYGEEIELRDIQGKIEKSEKEVSRFEAMLADPDISSDAAQLAKLCESLSLAQTEVDRMYARWEELEKKRDAPVI